MTLAPKLGGKGFMVGMDADEDALRTAKKRMESEGICNVRFFHGRFSEAGEVLKETQIPGFDCIIADLGVGSHQLDAAGRGFSFESDEPLDMRFDPTAGRSAREIINEEPEKSLADIIFNLGQERFSRNIAYEICKRRKNKPISKARELADVAKKVYASRCGKRRWRIHPATRTFMALRIYVNDEMGELERLLDVLPGFAAAGGRVVLITYHSLEARKVKTAWRRQEEIGLIELLTAKPIKPCENEVEDNPRARSAQLRAARFAGEDT